MNDFDREHERLVRRRRPMDAYDRETLLRAVAGCLLAAAIVAPFVWAVLS